MLITNELLITIYSMNIRIWMRHAIHISGRFRLIAFACNAKCKLFTKLFSFFLSKWSFRKQRENCLPICRQFNISITDIASIQSNEYHCNFIITNKNFASEIFRYFQLASCSHKHINLMRFTQLPNWVSASHHPPPLPSSISFQLNSNVTNETS